MINIPNKYVLYIARLVGICFQEPRNTEVKESIYSGTDEYIERFTNNIESGYLWLIFLMINAKIINKTAWLKGLLGAWWCTADDEMAVGFIAGFELHDLGDEVYIIIFIMKGFQKTICVQS